jgi:thymidine kinase
MPVLLSMADEVLKLKAVCMCSGKDAGCTQRIVDGKPAQHTEPLVVIGAQESYEARSRDYFEIDHKPLAEYLEKYF